MKSFLFFLLFTLLLPLAAQDAQPLAIDQLFQSETFGDERKITVDFARNDKKDLRAIGKLLHQ